MNMSLKKYVLAVALVWPITSQAGGLYLYGIGTSDLGFASAGTAARSEDGSSPSALVSGTYNNPQMFFISVQYTRRF